jgi:hypothetical protein
VGNDEEQVGFLRTLASGGFGLKAFEEEGSSFEDILVQVAEENRKS